jgi:hypothetical protein
MWPLSSMSMNRRECRQHPSGVPTQPCEGRHRRHRVVLWAITYLAFSTFLVCAAWPYLANFPPVSADEVWIMSASYKVATQGILGSDLFVGFHGSDKHYFLNLPVHHFVQAAFFKVFGPGIAQARAPSLLAAVSVLCAVGWLAYKWVGLGCSVATGILLLFWRSNLIAVDPRPPLLALAQSARYDVMVLSFWWLAVLMLNRHLGQPRRATAIAVGLLAGITALTQFYGAGVLICCAAALLWTKRQVRSRVLYGREVAIGALIPLLGYGTYIAAHWTDFIGQAALRSYRLRFYDPRFLLTNLLNEPHRFDWLLNASRDVIGRWTVALAIPLALLAVVRLFRRGNFLPLMSTVGAFLSLALLDSIKATIYASLLVPVLCFGVAVALTPTVSSWPHRLWAVLRAVTAWAFLFWIIVDGVGGYEFVSVEGPRVTRYGDVGRQIANAIEPQGMVFGSQRWWWALHTFPYRSLNAQWEIWEDEQLSNRTPDFSHMLDKFGGAYLIFDNDIRGDLTRVPSQLRQQVNDVLSSRAALVGVWRDRTYGLIEIYWF